MSGALGAKCFAIGIIFVGSLVFGLLPAFKIFSSFPRFALSLVLSYGGGILIATSLVHILPEAREIWPTETSFSAEMSLCLGIFVVYMVEEIAHFLVCHDLHSPLSHSGDGSHRGEGHDEHKHGVHVHHENPPNRCDEPAAAFLFAEEKTRSGEHGQSVNQNNKIGKCSSNHNHSCSSNPLHPSSNKGGEGDHPQSLKVLPEQDFDGTVILSVSKNRRKDEKKTIAQLRSLVGLIALSIHAGLEGLSVGLGTDSSDVWYLTGAVSAHKFVIAFCLGMEVRNASSNLCSLVQTSSSASFKVRYVLFFALMTPLGIAIGTIITEFFTNSENGVNTNSTLVAVLQTLASGTLLYVAFFEVILRERARFSGKGLYQLLFVIFGWSTMIFVEIYISGHNHSHISHNHEEHDHTHEHDVNNTNLIV